MDVYVCVCVCARETCARETEREHARQLKAGLRRACREHCSFIGMQAQDKCGSVQGRCTSTSLHNQPVSQHDVVAMPVLSVGHGGLWSWAKSTLCHAPVWVAEASTYMKEAVLPA